MFISEKIDPRQYGGLKGNATTHYMIEFLNFILSHQDSTAQTAVIACYIDFQKAFNRQNHNLLITKLSNMGVPGWLLAIVVAFLSNRKMVVRYNGSESSEKRLPVVAPKVLSWLFFSS